MCGVVILLRPNQASKFCEELIKGVDVYIKEKKRIRKVQAQSRLKEYLLTL